MAGHSTGQEASRAPPRTRPVSTGKPGCYLLTAMGRRVDLTHQGFSRLVPRKQGGSRAGCTARPSPRQGERGPSGSPAIPGQTPVLHPQSPSLSEKEQRGAPEPVPGSKVPRPHQLIQVKATLTPDSQRPQDYQPPVPADSFPYPPTLPPSLPPSLLGITPSLLRTPQTNLFSIPCSTSHRAAGNSWCVAQGHLAQGASTHIPDLCIYYNCLHFKEGTPSSYSHKDVTVGANKGPVNSGSVHKDDLARFVCRGLLGTSGRVTWL